MSLCLALLIGCEPSVPPEELGTIVEEPPEMPGTDKPYEMPELERAAAEVRPRSASDSTDAPKDSLPEKPVNEGGLHH